VVGDFNTSLSQKESEWDILREPLRVRMDDLISLWYLVDINPIMGRFIWTNKRIKPSHIAARLDRFLVQSSFLESDFSTSSKIVSWSTYEHMPIFLQLKEIPNYGPIPFHFHNLWLHNKTTLDVITCPYLGT
jgi:hypothetical protein